MSYLLHPFALLTSIVTGFGHTGRYEHLFGLSDAELERRGMDRANLVRGYVSGLGHC